MIANGKFIKNYITAKKVTPYECIANISISSVYHSAEKLRSLDAYIVCKSNTAHLSRDKQSTFLKWWNPKCIHHSTIQHIHSALDWFWLNSSFYYCNIHNIFTLIAKFIQNSFTMFPSLAKVSSSISACSDSFDGNMWINTRILQHTTKYLINRNVLFPVLAFCLIFMLSFSCFFYHFFICWKIIYTFKKWKKKKISQ